MSTSLAEYFTDELEKWDQQISLYRQELAEMENRLSDVIRRNSIPDIAGLVEEEQQKLNKISIKFFQLLNQFQKQKVSLKENSGFIDDTLIKEEAAKRQNALRRFMQQSEKEYIDTKHGCSNFLSGVLKPRK